MSECAIISALVICIIVYFLSLRLLIITVNAITYKAVRQNAPENWKRNGTYSTDMRMRQRVAALDAKYTKV